MSTIATTILWLKGHNLHINSFYKYILNIYVWKRTSLLKEISSNIRVENCFGKTINIKLRRRWRLIQPSAILCPWCSLILISTTTEREPFSLTTSQEWMKQYQRFPLFQHGHRNRMGTNVKHKKCAHPQWVYLLVLNWLHTQRQLIHKRGTGSAITEKPAELHWTAKETELVLFQGCRMLRKWTKNIGFGIRFFFFFLYINYGWGLTGIATGSWLFQAVEICWTNIHIWEDMGHFWRTVVSSIWVVGRGYEEI